MIKAYIFDQDGTVYSKKNILINVLRERTKKWISEKLNLRDVEIDELYSQLPRQFVHPYHGFLSLGLSPAEYHQMVFDKVNPADYLTKDNELINLFKRIQAPKFITTLASDYYSRQVQDRLGITSLVNDTISLIDYPPSYSKLAAYNSIKNRLHLIASEIFVIGDNLLIDIFPAIENGFKAALINEQEKSNKKYICINSIYELNQYI